MWEMAFPSSPIEIKKFSRTLLGHSWLRGHSLLASPLKHFTLATSLSNFLKADQE